MRITTQGEYGLRCVLDIARRKGKVVSIRDIIASEKLPKDYIEQLLIKLRRNGIIKSVRGVKGGYLLARSANKITVYDVVAALEKDVFSIFCDKAKGNVLKCIHISNCRLRSLWLQLKKDIESVLKKRTITSLLK